MIEHAQSGIKYDFCNGCRVIVPARVPAYKVRMDHGDLLHEYDWDGGAGKSFAGRIHTSFERWHVPWRLRAWYGKKNVLDHTWDATGKEVILHIPGVLGDSLSRMRAVLNFKERTNARLTCVLPDLLIPLYAGHPAYKGITFTNKPESKNYYAAYAVGVWRQPAEALMYETVPGRLGSLIDQSARVLGTPIDHEPPPINIEEGGALCSEPYVCIAAQGSNRSKEWHHRDGWKTVIAYLKDKGYRVICIDGDPGCPEGAEDHTGYHPLTQRARLLKHAEFFIGLTSGLSWLAWAARTPVVIIAGITKQHHEFDTPYQVRTPEGFCTGCHHDMRVPFFAEGEHHCPWHLNTPRQYECTKSITPDLVIQQIERLLENG